MGKILEQPASVKIICFITLIFFATIGIWIRPNLFGVDSYATQAFIKFGFGETLRLQPAANALFALLPDSIVLFKLILFSSIVAAIAPIFLLVKRFYDERTAWIVSFLLLGLSPIILFSFGEFENEILAYPFITWGIYWLLISDYLKFFVSFVGGTLFWKWFYYLSFIRKNSFEMLEAQSFSGLINFWFLFPFIFFICYINDRRARLLGYVSIVMVFWNTKFFIFLLPFLALAIPKGLEKLEKYPTLRFSLYIIAFCGLFGWNIAFFMQQPTNIDVFMVSEAIKLSKDTNLPLLNDPSFGYWIMAQGIKTPYNPGTWKKFDANVPGIYLTSKDLNCGLISSKEQIGRSKINIFQCN